MRVPLASPNLRPQERRCKVPGFAHQPQKEQKPQRGFLEVKLGAQGICARHSLFLRSICFSPPSCLCPPVLRHGSPGRYCNPVPSNSTRAMGL